ncbi:hypothetical protein ACQPW1_06500 [Nocardia sp. CA-128927]|uniref:hypothetical protein n=1 Tax=Nocardia sp. CA-128927 TaxID=3239975 RepID=UPI003D96184A
MGSTPTDRVMHQLRGDVDGLYELSTKTNQKVTETSCTVRGIDTRLQRLEATSGRQFGVLLATQRQHGHRLNRVEKLLGEVVTQLADLAPLPARVDELTGRVDGLSGRMDHLTERVDKLADLPARVGRLEGQVAELTVVVRQNSETLDVVVDLLRKRLPASQDGEG